MVAKDTPPKRQQVEPNIVVAVRLKEAPTAQDFTAMVTAVQQTFAVERVAFDTQANTVYMRGPISKVLPARAMFEDLLHPRAQVMLEVKLLEVSLNDTLTYGVKLPTTAALFPQVMNFANLAFGASHFFLGFQTLQTVLVAQMMATSGRSLLDAEVRSADGQPATLHTGEKYPVLTAGYFGPQSFQGPGSYSPPPSFTFQDLGLSLKLTPNVQSTDSLFMDFESDFKVLTGQAVNGIPVIANRSVKSGFQVKFGEWALITGLLDTSDSKTLNGIPGMSQIPLVGQAAGIHEHDKTNDQVLLLIRPQLITLPPSVTAPRTFYVGSDTRPLTPL